MSNSIITIRDLNKRIKGNKIIKNLNLDLYTGEVFGFLGPNGAGKTSTIRMMCGLASITSGEIHINGYNLKKSFEKAMREVGAIIEYPSIYEYLTGRQNLEQYARMYKDVTKDRINEVASIVKMSDALDKKVKTYSLGMKQRIGLAQALLHDPSVLILDEPMNGLDPLGIKELRKLIRNIAEQEQKTVFISSHILTEMELLCDRVGIINNGTLLSTFTLEELANEGVTLEDKFFELTI